MIYDYHDKKRRKKTKKAVWKIGVEIEKIYPEAEEDMLDGTRTYGADMIDAKTIYRETGWIAENDSSLRSEGFELVSPVYALYSNHIFRDIKTHPHLRNIINYPTNHLCGGHIHISHSDKESMHVFIKYFLPITGFFYTLYKKRTGNKFCAVSDKRSPYVQVEKIRSKYAPFFLTEKTLEIRIFPSVHNLTQLEWRVKLLRILLKKEYTLRSLVEDLCNPKSRISKHLSSVVGRQRVKEIIAETINATRTSERKKIYLKQINDKKFKY